MASSPPSPAPVPLATPARMDLPPLPRLNFPWGIAIAPDSSLLIADRSNNRIRRITADGKISLVAGTGTCGSTGDAGPALKALICAPLSSRSTPKATSSSPTPRTAAFARFRLTGSSPPLRAMARSSPPTIPARPPPPPSERRTASPCHSPATSTSRMPPPIAFASSATAP